MYRLTRESLINLLCRDGEDRQYLNHDLYDGVRHCCGRLNFCIRHQPPEKLLYTLENIHEQVLVRIDILGRLADIVVMMTRNSTRSKRSPT
jgi:hypothetical protein